MATLRAVSRSRSLSGSEALLSLLRKPWMLLKNSACHVRATLPEKMSRLDAL